MNIRKVSHAGLWLLAEEKLEKINNSCIRVTDSAGEILDRFELLFNSSVSLFYERAFLRRIVACLSYIGCKDAS